MQRTFPQEVFEILYPIVSDKSYALEDNKHYENAIIVWHLFAYLMGCINYNSSIPHGKLDLEMEFEEHKIFLSMLEANFAKDHKLWQHIHVIEPDPKQPT